MASSDVSTKNVCGSDEISVRCNQPFEGYDRLICISRVAIVISVQADLGAVDPNPYLVGVYCSTVRLQGEKASESGVS